MGRFRCVVRSTLWRLRDATTRPTPTSGPGPDESVYLPVEIVWADAYAATTTWTDPAAVPTGTRLIRTVGLLLFENDDVTVVAQSFDVDADRVDHVLCIPTVTVVDCKPL